MTKEMLKEDPGPVERMTRLDRKTAMQRAEGSISDRHLSPALRGLPAQSLKVAALTSYKARIYNALWRPIADGRMKAGAVITEGALNETFGVSATISKEVLNHMAGEGYVAASVHKAARVVEPTTAEAVSVLEVLGVVMGHIVRDLARPGRTLSAGQRRLIDMHLKAQGQADEADDAISAHLLGIEFLILLAVLHGSLIFTDLVGRTVVMLTLSLKLHGRFPPPPRHVAFQRRLADAILGHKPEEAVAELDARLADIRGTLVLERYEEDDIAKLLGAEG
ncbi:MAG: GntR family transcriptional regulator [Novosphingobium sp.]|jgi:DNA-binding GntR family transcriptional regulator|nr:GntR family transcriptional regulator [Novosphingobium sp.]